MLYDIWTVFWRDWVVLKHRMIKFILSRMVAPILYMVAFGWGLGRSINTGTGSYLDFLVPGILALNSMNIAFNSLTPVHAERIYHKSLEEYLVSPIRPIAFVAGKILAGCTSWNDFFSYYYYFSLFIWCEFYNYSIIYNCVNYKLYNLCGNWFFSSNDSTDF